MADGSLRESLQELCDSLGGQMTAEAVVEAARPVDSPLHDAVFDKPVGEAAEAHYRENARQLIRRYKITFRTASGQERHVRAWQSVPAEGGATRVYRPTEDVVADPMLRRILLKDMERDWKQLQERYSALEEFADMVMRDIRAA